MKKWLFRIWILGMLLLLPAVVYAEEKKQDEPVFSFQLAVDDQMEAELTPGQIVTVSFSLIRKDSSEAFTMYAMQNEICYDDTFLQIVPGSCTTAAGVCTEDIALVNGGRAIYMNYVSAEGGTPWNANQIIGTFKMEVLNKAGNASIISSNYKVTVEDGSRNYESDANVVALQVGCAAESEIETDSETQTENETETDSETNRETETETAAVVELTGDEVKGDFGQICRELLEKVLQFWKTHPWLWAVPALLVILFIALFVRSCRKCRIVFECNGGTPLQSVQVRKNQTPDRLPVPVRSNSVFGGWYKDAKLTKPWYAGVDRIRKKKTKLYAKWR